MNGFVKGNPDLCIGCRTCMIGCVVSHEGLRIFEVDQQSYNFNPKLHVVKTKKISVPVQCKHCENPACMAACQSGAITKNEDGVIINKKKCIGCKECMEACPFGAINMAPDMNYKLADGTVKIIANKCDLCAGIKGGPACVRVCPTQCLKLVTEEELNEEVQNKRISAVRGQA